MDSTGHKAPITDEPNTPQVFSTSAEGRLVSALMACTSDLVLIIDADQRSLIACNDRATQRLGLPSDDPAANQVSAWLIDPEADLLSHLDASRSLRPPDEVDVKCRNSTGTIIDLRLRLMALTLDDRQLLLLMGEDQTEQRRTQAALTQREASFRSLVESIETGYIFYRQMPDRSFTYISPTIEQVLGYSAEAFATIRAETVTDNPLNKNAEAATAAALAGERQPPFDIEMTHRSGALRRLRISEYPVFDAQGQVVALQGIAQDVTEAWRNRLLLDARNQVLEQIAQGQSLEQAMETLTRGIEALEPGMHCSVLRFDAQERRLFGLAVSSLPSFYALAVEGIQVDAELGSCGAAACTGKRMIVADILSHPYWAPFHDLMAQTNLRACWSEPVLGSRGEVLGTFAMYFESVREPTEGELLVITSAADLAAVAIQHRRDAEALAFAEERARLLLESSTEGIFGLDLEGRIGFINPAAAAMLGYPADTLLGETPHGLLRHARDDDTPFEAQACPLHAAATQGIEQHGSNTLLRRQDGSRLPIEYHAAPIRHGGHADGAVVSFHDITERLEQERRIAFLAFHDALTGLANRRLFGDQLGRALALYRRGVEHFALHLMDLDAFKEINDQLGHPTGDRLLCAIAERVKALLRESDVFARLGGDEFAVIQVGIKNAADATRLASRIIEAMRRDFELGSLAVHSGSSIGIALPEPGITDAAELMKRADIALYRAKNAGRGISVLFEPE
jgi:diguanylate cyclase (GGDEF)-like protein/PAS domain S-box-containing protein